MFTSLSAESFRLVIFLGLLGLFAALEAVVPRKRRVLPRAARWRTNAGLVILGSAALRLLGPFAALSLAAYASSKGWGIFNMTDLPMWAEFILSLLLLDLAIYAQHLAFHHVPLFWRFHKVHHADRDIDVTTALRFHPVEIAVSMLFKGLLVLLIGPAVLAVLVFEIVLNGMAMFNHANIGLPLWLDKRLRVFVVTPDMHRVHHSVLPRETNSNYGFNLSVWDRLFRTYRAQPDAGHDGMTIGLERYQTDGPARLFWSLLLPFKR